MTAEQDMLLAAPRAALDRVRHDPDGWDDEYDYGLLLAMSFDRRPDDLPLARRMLRAVIRYHREHVPSGVTGDLVRAGLLVADHRRTDDVWLHWEALELGFDPAGYRPLLAAAGLLETLRLVLASAKPDRARLAAELARLRKVNVTEWLEQHRAAYPEDPARESLLNWATHARELGEPDLAHRFLLDWARARPRDLATLATVRSRLGRLGFAAEAVEIQREAVAITTGRERLGHELVTLASVCREAGDTAPRSLRSAHLTAARRALDEAAALAPPLGGLATSIRREAQRLADARRPGTTADPGPS